MRLHTKGRHFLTSESVLESRTNEPLSSSTIVACSAASKMVASVATYPHEVVRTRLQTQKRPVAASPLSSSSSLPSSRPLETPPLYSSSATTPSPPTKYLGVVQTTKVILHEETWRGLYKGLSINLFRTVPNSVVTMLT